MMKMLKTPISYYGGKQGMLKDILPLIPKHNTYTEAFAGGAAVLFSKEPANINVINDLNSELVNFYRTVITDYESLKMEILRTMHCREHHEIARFIYKHPDYFTNIQRAWALWALSRLCFSAQLDTSFAFSKSGKTCRTTRLKNARLSFGTEIKELLDKCTIEQDDALKIITRYDTKETFHFIDPPYVGFNMGHYSGMFSDEDLKRLLDLLVGIDGKFMLTMYPNGMIDQYARSNKWIIHRIERTVSASIKRRKQEEWMICNYHE